MQRSSKVYSFLIIIVSIIITITFLEIFVRVLHLIDTDHILNIYINDHLLGWKLKPGIDVKVSTPEYQMHVVTNHQGFRDNNHTVNKSSDKIRLIGIGDSFLFGYGVNKQNDVLSKLSYLIDKNNHIKIEPINLGIPGYNINQYNLVLKNIAFKYDPNMILIFFYTNDFQRNNKFDYIRVNSQGFLISRAYSGTGFWGRYLYDIHYFIKLHSRLYLYLEPKIKYILQRNALRNSPINFALFHCSNNLYKKYHHTFALIALMKKECNLHNVIMVFCFIPNKLQIDRSYRNKLLTAYGLKTSQFCWDLPQQALASYCTGLGINFVDFTDSLKVADQDKPVYFKSDIHWNKIGHAVAARVLYDYLMKNYLSKEKGIVFN